MGNGKSSPHQKPKKPSIPISRIDSATATQSIAITRSDGFNHNMHRSHKLECKHNKNTSQNTRNLPQIYNKNGTTITTTQSILNNKTTKQKQRQESHPLPTLCLNVTTMSNISDISVSTPTPTLHSKKTSNGGSSVTSITSPQCCSKQYSITLSSPSSVKRCNSSSTTNINTVYGLNNTLSPHSKYLTHFKYYNNKHQYEYRHRKINKPQQVYQMETSSPQVSFDSSDSDRSDRDIICDLDESKLSSIQHERSIMNHHLHINDRDSNSSTNSTSIDSGCSSHISVASCTNSVSMNISSSTINGVVDDNKNQNDHQYEHDDDMRDISTNNAHKRIEVNNGINGITGKYISLSMVQIVYEFWMNHIEMTDIMKKNEIAIAIYFELMQIDETFYKILYKHFKKSKNMKIVDIAIKIVNILGVIFKCLLRADINMFKVIRKYDPENLKHLLQFKHVNMIIKAINTTFSHYFDRQYVVEVRYSIEYILHVIGYIGLYDGDCDNNLGFEYHIKQKLLDTYNKRDYLLSTRKCLDSSFGRKYLFHYIHQTSCDELVLFLKEYFKYKTKTSPKEQLMIIQQIIKKFINPNSVHCLNISYDCRKNVCFPVYV